jgi:hypothetical protein
LRSVGAARAQWKSVERGGCLFHCREGQWSVLDCDPDLLTLGDAPPAAPQQPLQLPYSFHSGHYHNNAGAYFSTDYELEELKARLERLLPEE